MSTVSGAICAAKVFGKWQRVMVEKVCSHCYLPAGNSVDLNCIDTGCFVEDIRAEELRKLPPDLVEDYQVCAFHCCLEVDLLPERLVPCRAAIFSRLL